MRIRKAMVLVALATAAAFTLGLVAPALATAAKKPDLVVDPGRRQGQPYDVIGKRYRLTVGDTTKNRGRKVAGTSTTVVSIVGSGPNHPVEEVSRRVVSALGPGERDRGSPRRTLVNRAQAGKYGVIICADWKNQIEESDEGNNCANLPGSFYSAYETYRGTLSGSAWGGSFTPDTTETWSSANAEIKLKSYAGNGSFSYVGSGGTVTFTQSGSHNGCTYSGGGSVGIDSTPGTIQVQHGAERYVGGLSTKVDAYQFQQNCGGQITNLDGPTGGYLMNLFPPGAALLFGSTAIEGQGGDSFFGEEYSWDLQGRSAG